MEREVYVRLKCPHCGREFDVIETDLVDAAEITCPYCFVVNKAILFDALRGKQDD